MSIFSRKDDHIRIVSTMDVESGWTLFDEVHLIHNALPEMDFDEVNTEVTVFNKKLSSPFIVGSLTGGTELAAKINSTLARIVEEMRLGMYVGSQRIAIQNPEVRWTFEVVKENAPTALKIANLGAPQISRIDESKIIDWVNEAVDMINADAVAIHLNPAQEVFQPEGEPWFRGLLDRIRYVSRSVNRPIIIKEVGNGISREVVLRLRDTGIGAIDVAGAGGTSFIKVEDVRSGSPGLSQIFEGWGLPTAVSICEVRSAFEGLIIASGGLRSGLDGAKAIALGADLFSMSRPMLQGALKGLEEARRVILDLLRAFRIAMFLTGSKNVSELKNTPVVLGPRITTWLRQRGISCRGIQ